MKDLEIMKKNRKRLAGMILTIYSGMITLMAQAPTGIDTRAKDPRPFTLDDVLLYIVFPAVLFVTAFLVHRRQKKQAKKKNQTQG
jgi:hypothetical protein